ncbi:hypothetical protein IFO70_15385 [Phormidium tenue FACHB-886]|nr:hypothetical protein [Phormidium tenue FACHB-886]
MALPAEAALCHTLDHRQVCIVTIKRSAKNYWEYRVGVSVDGVKQPIEVYNCHDRLRTQADGKLVPFASNGTGTLICRTLKQ